MSGVAHVAAYLQALEAVRPLSPGFRYTLHAVELGSDVQGWTPALHLTVPGVEPIFLEGDDLEKPVERLVQETIDTINRAAELKRNLAAMEGRAA